MDYFAYFHKFEMALFSRQKVIKFVPGVSLYIPCNLFWKLNILVLHFYSSCLSLYKVAQDFYDFGNNSFSQKQNDCSAEYKVGRYHLRIERWKRLQCNTPFGRKELSNTFRYVFSHVVRVVNLPGKWNKTCFLLPQLMCRLETLREKGETLFWLSWFMWLAT